MQSKVHKQADSEKARAAPKQPESEPEAGREPLLGMQALVGNRAVQRLVADGAVLPGGSNRAGVIQREPDQEGQATKEAGGEQPKQMERPWWLIPGNSKVIATAPSFTGGERLAPIDGEPVEGFNDRMDATYTEDDRNFLYGKLMDRNLKNAANRTSFVTSYTDRFLNLWVKFVTDVISEEAAEVSFGEALVGFAVRQSLGHLYEEHFNIEHLAEHGHHFKAFTMKAPAEIGMEIFQVANSEAGEAKENKEKGEGLEGVTEKLSLQLRKVIDNVVLPVAEGAYYTEWLARAPLEQLYRFRLPEEYPQINDEDIEINIAQAFAGAYYSAPHPANESKLDASRQTIAHLTITALGKEASQSTVGPLFFGPKAFAEALVGKPIGMMPNMPLDIYLWNNYAALGDVPGMIDALGGGMMGEAMLDVVGSLWDAWPEKNNLLVIHRDPDGKISVSGGGLGTSLHLYERAHPGGLRKLLADWNHEQVAREGETFYLSGQERIQMMANDLHGRLAGSMNDGAAAIITQSVNPLPLQSADPSMKPEPPKASLETGGGEGAASLTAKDASAYGSEQGEKAGQQAAATQAPGAPGEPGKEAAGSPAEKGKTPAPAIPTWLHGNKPGEHIPGDPVPGLTDRVGPYSEADRGQLFELLRARDELNGPRVAAFAANYASIFYDVWTSYVINEMDEAVEKAGWDAIYKVIGLIAKASLMAVFEVYAVEAVFEEIAASAVSKVSDFVAEQGLEALEKRAQLKGVEKRADELREMSTMMSKKLSTVLTATILPLVSGSFYMEWLGRANVNDLYQFRLPPVFPDVTPEAIETSVTQTLAGYVNSKGDMFEKENFITVDIEASSPQELKAKYGPSFHGSPAFGKRLAGRPLNQMPAVPIIASLDVTYPILAGALSQMDDDMKNKMNFVHDAWTNWPIKLHWDGRNVTEIEHGSLADWIYLLQIAKPDADPFSLILQLIPGASEKLDDISFMTNYIRLAEKFKDDTMKDAKFGAELFMMDSVLKMNL